MIVTHILILINYLVFIIQFHL